MRQYEAVEKLQMGKQMQVDFGETKLRHPGGHLIKLWFITFVLSCSRYKYALWQDRPFTTADVVYAHEQAFTFYGGFGMVNIQGIKKPSFHAYRFLSKLVQEELLRGESYIVTKNSEGKLRALFYNDADELKQTIPISYYPNYHGAEEIQALSEDIHVKGVLSGFAAGTCVDLEILDVNHRNVTTKWKELGHPDSLTTEQTAELKAYADNTEKISVYADNQGNLSLDFTMGKWAIVLLEEN